MEQFFAEYGLMLLWAIIAISTLAVEATTVDMISIWFTPGALVAMILSIWVDIFWVQLLVFLALSAILLCLTRRYFKKHPQYGKDEKMNADAIVGKTGIVQEAIDNIRETGSVKVGALVWTARAAEASVTIPEGTVVIVKDIVGVKVICEPVSSASSRQPD